MATNTYVALKTTTLSSSVPSVVLDNIPQGYTDLVLVIMGRDDRGGGSVADGLGMAFNTDTSTGSTNYSTTHLSGNGSSPSSTRASNQRHIDLYQIAASSATSGVYGVLVSNIQNYSNTTTFKTVITRGGVANEVTDASVGLWRNTAAINTITLYPGYNGSGYNWVSGSTFTIYGIAAEGALAKATGGAIYSDSQYWYHAFASSGTFTPTQSLTADILVVAGGGSGGNRYGNAGGGGGGGAGGVLGFSAQSLSATGYTVTVGGGGSAVGGGSEVNGSAGTNSSFGGLTAAVGGGYGQATPGSGGGSGGSGGGGRSRGNTGGSATSGQGFAGGDGGASSDGGGGGGGAGAIGVSTTSGTSGAAGGAGTNTYSTWLATVGAGVDGYIAGGGGGGAYTGGSGGAGGIGGGGAGSLNSTATSGKVNSGSGGGSAGANTTGSWTSGSGGSGIVIVRYAK